MTGRRHQTLADSGDSRDDGAMGRVVLDTPPRGEIRERRPTAQGWIVTGVVVLIVGVVVTQLGSSGIQDSSDVPDTFTASTRAPAPTTTAPAVATDDGSPEGFAGPPLQWRMVERGVPDRLGHIARHDGSLFAPGAAAEGEGTATTMWRSPDGVSWQPMGVIDDQAISVSAVAVGDAGFAVAGVMVDADGGASERRVWTSSDGLTWSEHEFHVPSVHPDVTYDTWVSAIAISSDTAIAFGFTHPDVEAVIRPLLPAEMLTQVEEGSAWLEWFGPELQVWVRDQSGDVILQTDGAELGLADEFIDEVTRFGGMTRVVGWRTTDLDEWVPFDVEAFGPDTRIHSIVSTPNRGFVAIGTSGPLARTWSTVDGSAWRRVDDRTELHHLAAGSGGRLVGAAWTTGVWELRPDGWETTAPRAPRVGGDSWTFAAADVDGDHIAAAMSTFDASAAPAVGFSVLDEVGKVVLYDTNRGVLEVIEAEGDVLTWVSLDSIGTSDQILYSDDGREVSFLDVAGQEIVASMDADDFAETVARASIGGLSNERWAVIHSSGPDVWSYADVSDVIAQPGTVDQVIISGGNVVVVWRPLEFAADGSGARFKAEPVIWIGAPVG